MWLAGATVGLAQSNGVPGPQDYSAFSRFITDRNIFDPSRQPHFTSSGRNTNRRHRAASPPDLQLVGTMSYAKGLFAFFNSSNPDLKKALQAMVCGRRTAGGCGPTRGHRRPRQRQRRAMSRMQRMRAARRMPVRRRRRRRP
jgi:hypothetical protein